MGGGGDLEGWVDAGGQVTCDVCRCERAQVNIPERPRGPTDLLFNSYPFVLGFLPALILAYALVAQSAWRDLTPWLLVGASLFFYAYWNWTFLPLFLFSVLFNYSWALLLDGQGPMDDARTVMRRKTVLGVGIAVNLALLFYFKYRDF